MSVYFIWESDFSPANAAAGLGLTEAIWRGEKPLLGCVQGKPRRWLKSSARTPGTTASADCSFAGNASAATTSPSFTGPAPHRLPTGRMTSSGWVLSVAGVPGVTRQPQR